MSDQAQEFESATDSADQQRRLYERFSTRFPAKFKDARGDFGTEVFLRDTSAGGARISTKDRLFLNDHVTLEVELPDGIDPMVMRGEVVWSKHKDTGLWDAGLKFYKVVLMDLWRIQKMIETPLAP